MPKPETSGPKTSRARRAMAVELGMPAAQMPVRTLDMSRGARSCASISSLKCVSKPWSTRGPLARRSGRGSPPGRSVSVRTWRAPLTIEMSRPSEKPKRWKSGRYIMMTSRAVMARRKARSVTLRTMRWQCIAPLGKPVVPEVYMRKARSSGSTASARAASAASSTRAPPASTAPHATVSGRGASAEEHDVPRAWAAAWPRARPRGGTSSRTMAR